MGREVTQSTNRKPNRAAPRSGIVFISTRRARSKAATDSAATRRSTRSAALYHLFPPTFLRSAAATFIVSRNRAIYNHFWREEEGWSSSFPGTTVEAQRHPALEFCRIVLVIKWPTLVRPIPSTA